MQGTSGNNTALSEKTLLPKEMSAAATNNPVVPTDDGKNERRKP